MSESLTSVPLKSKPIHRHVPRWTALVVFIVLIGLWQLCSHLGWINPLALASPSEIWSQLAELVKSGGLSEHLGASVQRLALGWSLGTVAGVLVGLLIGLWIYARAGLLPLVSALFPVPKIALLPLFVVWFGIGEGSKIATILFGVFFPTVISTYAAVDGVERGLIRMGQSFGLSTFAIIRKIILPGALPGILAGCRISYSIGITMVVAAEMIGAQKGIGTYILNAGALFRIDQLLAGVVLLSLLGLTGAFLIGLVEKIALQWRE